MRVVLDDIAICPTRAHDTDAGLDLYSPCDLFIPAEGDAVVNTGVHVELPAGTVGFIKSRSGLYVHHDITCEGVIDEGYTGAIVVKLLNNGCEPYRVRSGDRIAQLVILPCLKPELEVVEALGETERGRYGFGSTGC